MERRPFMGMAWGAVERMMKLQEVICRALAGSLTWLQAADILGLDPRSVRRWRARYQAGRAAAGPLPARRRAHRAAPGHRAPLLGAASVRAWQITSSCRGPRTG